MSDAGRADKITIKADDEYVVAVAATCLDITSHEDGVRIYIPLGPSERRALAATLNPDQGTGTGRQWTREDIDRALINVTSNAMNYPNPSQMLGKDSGPLRKKCVDAVCDLLGVEAEAAVDPVEELAAQIEAAAREAIRQVRKLGDALGAGQ